MVKPIIRDTALRSGAFAQTRMCDIDREQVTGIQDGSVRLDRSF